MNKEQSSGKGSNLERYSGYKNGDMHITCSISLKRDISEKRMLAYKQSFARSHETTEINTNPIPHSSYLDSSYNGFGQAQYVSHFVSSVKIVLIILTNIRKTKTLSKPNKEALSQELITFRSRTAFTSSTFKTTPPRPCSRAYKHI